ncbi:MAG TPA: DUF2935 domain-containing protein [Hungateiclostridium thermocellum]|jgi:hypothetical protein|uniref:DUF2935 domain-containing protein n=2 Tax=Acetivibrio thermocellus TaxID=1515 RepID=A3DFE4_ACET2|nr:DUF2935 domain-containing protein [Acetivibrio thermocellus]ABN52673.1 hypothetical protein Cthe_1443 [Acetivibrio thermocellus ATCC 27405]ADU73879.1 hypothetical protein Clo1313_0809 [Acetivibrio thermocellus DSM 1313]ALX07818.1 Protein of unknown function DUF2935 [Acetivibrio thermocellus AD2]ANV75560.1 Protein of unknown function DUF2935 [Acetivibrio thermocellus DSM 2360]EIC03307.1 hypothetical protein YSBL_0140 [Acetivibrio thermocellus YS]
MLSSIEFIKQSLGLHLFFARIMKEHSFFLEVGFTSKDSGFIQQADAFRREFDGILGETISLSNSVVNPEILQSGEVITPFTLNAEMATIYFTGVRIPTQLTQAEARLAGSDIITANPVLERHVSVLNQRAINATAALIQFKKNILSNVLYCKMFTFNYPLLILHITREAELYLLQLRRLQRREEIDLAKEAYELQFFWNRQMAEHAKFIRGLLDPTENDLINQANDFGNEFDQLTAEAKAAMDATSPMAKVTDESLKATEDFRNFKAQGTQAILECKVKSIIIPLLGDHVLREANHYLRLLKMFEGR